jgi:hypothetical protein
MVAPHHDCPPCQACGCPVGVPIRTQEPGRWYGPDESTLFCPACGVGWIGTPDEVEQAEKAQAAWEQHENNGRSTT